MKANRLLTLLILVFSVQIAVSGDSYREWTLEKAIQVLTNSSWARQETYTRVIGGIGSGIQGEKEIYDTYFIRILSAQPIRQAFARVQQIQSGYDSLSAAEQKEVDNRIKEAVELDVQDWIVVALSFRSNNPRQEARIQRFFRSETTETLKTRAFLSTANFPKLPIYVYFPPKESIIGAKFVFPRTVNGIPVVGPKDESLAFELDTPGNDPELRAVFSVQDMIMNGELEL